MCCALTHRAPYRFAAAIRTGDFSCPVALSALNFAGAATLVAVNRAAAITMRAGYLTVTTAVAALAAVAGTIATGTRLVFWDLHGIVFGFISPFFEGLAICVESGVDEFANLAASHLGFVHGDLAAAATGGTSQLAGTPARAARNVCCSLASRAVEITSSFASFTFEFQLSVTLGTSYRASISAGRAVQLPFGSAMGTGHGLCQEHNHFGYLLAQCPRQRSFPPCQALDLDWCGDLTLYSNRGFGQKAQGFRGFGQVVSKSHT